VIDQWFLAWEILMSKALIIHLSDIHIRNENDIVLTKAELVASAVQDIERDLDAVVILISGDVAFSGGMDQYLLFMNFLTELQDHLLARTGIPHVHTVAIPGNHDLDFTQDNNPRSRFLESVLQNPTEPESFSVIDIFVSPQENFFNFLDAIESPKRDQIADSHPRLAYRYKIPVGSKRLEVLCFNSPWLSQKRDVQGALTLWEQLVPVSRQQSHVVLAMFHHPYNWLHHLSKRPFQKRIESISDIVLTGHEHDATIRSQAVSSGEANTYIEAGALFDSAIPDQSAFNVIVLDLDSRMQKLGRMRWDGEHYVTYQPSVDEESDAFGLKWEPFQAQRIQSTAGFQLSSEMNQFLIDMGSPIIHKSKGALHLDDVFVYPSV
jgi:hypothetical protein